MLQQSRHIIDSIKSHRRYIHTREKENNKQASINESYAKEKKNLNKNNSKKQKKK
jgi:hypothetical protein